MAFGQKKTTDVRGREYQWYVFPHDPRVRAVGPLGPLGCSIPVGVALERPGLLDADVVGLLRCERGHLGSQRWKVQAGDLLVKLLGEEVDVVLVALLLGFQKVELRQHLVSEGARHDKRRVAGRATQIQEASR